MPYPRQVSEADIERLREVAQARRAPSDKALASELGISVRAVQYWMARIRDNADSSPRFIPLDRPCSMCGGPRDRTSHWYCRKCFAEYCRNNRTKYSELNPEQLNKQRARSVANMAQRDGRLIRQPCEKCGDESSEKHHDDYSQPLAVKWLCRGCHSKEHETSVTGIL